MQAALDGSREIGFTILSMTLSLVAVFIPVLFMGGLLGRLFHEFAVTISVAHPRLGLRVAHADAHAVQPVPEVRARRRSTAGSTTLDRERATTVPLDAYERSLAWVMDHRRTAMVFSLGILVGTVLLFQIVPKGFIPSEDTGQLQCTTETAEGTAFESMVEHQKAVAAIVQQDPNVMDFMSTAGGGGGSSTNQGRFFIRLKPRNQRKLSADEVIRELGPKLARVPGIRVLPDQPAGHQRRRPRSRRASTSSRCRAPTSLPCTTARRR